MELLACVALVVLLSEAWSLDRVTITPGNNQTTEKHNASDSALERRVIVKNSTSFRQEEDVNLTCGYKTWTKDKLLYIIWTLNLKNKTCTIRSNLEGDGENTCQDQKSLRNSTEGQPVLHIPHFSFSDVGNYSCESPYSGGVYNYMYYVSITAPPAVSSWIESRGDRTVAMCRAHGGSPTATIAWTLTENFTMEFLEADGLVSVQSSVEVSADEDPQNLSCIVTHPYWSKPQLFVPELIKSQTTSQNRSVIYVTVAVSVVFCLTLLLWAIKKLHNLRRCPRSSSKSPAEEYVEEVEPYESYVQRVNSIYNSSRDLFA